MEENVVEKERERKRTSRLYSKWDKTKSVLVLLLCSLPKISSVLSL